MPIDPQNQGRSRRWVVAMFLIGFALGFSSLVPLLLIALSMSAEINVCEDDYANRRYIVNEAQRARSCD